MDTAERLFFIYQLELSILKQEERDSQWYECFYQKHKNAIIAESKLYERNSKDEIAVAEKVIKKFITLITEMNLLKKQVANAWLYSFSLHTRDLEGMTDSEMEHLYQTHYYAIQHLVRNANMPENASARSIVLEAVSIFDILLQVPIV